MTDESHEQGGALARGLPRASSDDQAPATPRPAPVRPATGVGAVARCPGRAPARRTVAWRVTLMGIDSVCAATSRGKAIAVAMGNATEAGYRVKWTEARCRRAPEHDAWAEVDESRHGWGEEYLPKVGGTDGH